MLPEPLMRHSFLRIIFIRKVRQHFIHRRQLHSPKRVAVIKMNLCFLSKYIFHEFVLSKKAHFLFDRNEQFFPTHIRAKSLRNPDRTIRIQIVFQEGNQHSWGSDYSIIQGMGKIFASICSVYTDF